MWRRSVITKAVVGTTLPNSRHFWHCSITPNWNSSSSSSIATRNFSAKNRKRKEEKRRKRHLKEEEEKLADPIVAHTTTKTVTAPATFSSDFDDRCAVYISSLLERFPVTLKRTPDFGMGLFASRDIEPMTRGSEVNFENPAFALTQSIADRMEAAIDDDSITTGPVVLGSNSWTVAAMVEETLASTQYPCKPSDYLPIRCLGSIPKKSMSVETAFQLIRNAYQLPSSVWTEEECLLLHNKVATNKIVEELYIAASMFNHSCEFNVAWSPSEPLRRLVAVKPIQKGEQLFISYSDEIDPVKRHAYLFEQFGFYCTCPVCKKAGWSSISCFITFGCQIKIKESRNKGCGYTSGARVHLCFPDCFIHCLSTEPRIPTLSSNPMRMKCLTFVK
jgi:hypothetical protein